MYFVCKSIYSKNIRVYYFKLNKSLNLTTKSIYLKYPDGKFKQIQYSFFF